MLFSMTGFGRNVTIDGSHKYTVEAKSLNSKQLDLNLRIPPLFREHEMEVRDKIAKVVERGKVDVNVYVEEVTSENSDTNDAGLVNLNVPAIRSVKSQIEKVSEELNIPVPSDWYPVFLRFPEVLHSDRPLPLASEKEYEALKMAIEDCIVSLMKFREKEGKTLTAFFKEKIENIRTLLLGIEKFEHERVAKIKEKIIEGLKKLPQVEHDKNRLEQEMIFYIEKLDVTEEKQRLSHHLDYFTETIDQKEPGQGKKLGFIAQEIGREINTLGSKSNHAEMQKVVVRMKDELEQVKEQVLNVM